MQTVPAVPAPPIALAPPAPPPAAAADRSGRNRRFLEIGLAVACFLGFCVVVLTKASKMLEPDDYAYIASIVALGQGHVELTTAQYHALSRQLGDGGSGIVQWIQLANGRWISQKNPGYPFAAVVFDLLGMVRVTPLFYGAVACSSLYVGARRWLGRYGGTFAVLLYCTSGAAITFAWRATMPSFTDASLVAAGAGLLLWALLATDRSVRRRTIAGLGAFVCLEAATFIRYTDVIELGLATVVVLLLARRTDLPWRTVAGWLATVLAFGVGVLVFDAVVYGSATTTGYANANITFALSALGPNLASLPWRLVQTMPMVIPAAAAVVWIAVRLVRQRRRRVPLGSRLARDTTVAGALLLGWAAIWGLYFCYTWTVGQGGAGDPVHVIRFYLPAIGLIALLGAFTLVNIPRTLGLATVVALAVLGLLSFHSMATAAGPGGGAGFPGLGGGSGGPSGGHLGRPGGGRLGRPGGESGRGAPGSGRPPALGRGLGRAGLPSGKGPGGRPPGSTNRPPGGGTRR